MNFISGKAGVIAVVALVIATIGLFTPSGQNVLERIVEKTPLAGITNFDTLQVNQHLVNSVSSSWHQDSIDSGSNTDSWQNTTGGTVFIDLFALETSGVASSSFRILAHASSSAPLTGENYTNYTPLIRQTAINVLVATSSAATTTSMALSTKDGVSAGIVPVPANAYLDVVIHNASGVAGAPDPVCTQLSLRYCEAATSTSNGLGAVKYQFRYFSTTTSELPSGMR